MKIFYVTWLNDTVVAIDKFIDDEMNGWGTVYPEDYRRLFLEVGLLVAEGYNTDDASRAVMLQVQDRIVQQYIS